MSRAGALQLQGGSLLVCRCGCEDEIHFNLVKQLPPDGSLTVRLHLTFEELNAIVRWCRRDAEYDGTPDIVNPPIDRFEEDSDGDEFGQYGDLR